MEINSIFFSKRSCFRVLPSLLHYHVFLLHQVEERKEEDGDGGNRWDNMSIIVMSLSQYISHYDMASLSGEIGAPASNQFIRLISALLSPISILRLGVLF